MAKSKDMGIADVPFTAAVDLTAKQYHFVRAGSVVGEVLTANGASNPMPLGILQNSPSAGQEARVRMFGFSKVVGDLNATCILKYGSVVICASDGQAEMGAVVTGSVVCGRWMDSSVTGASVYGQMFFYGTSVCTVSAS